MKKTLISSVCSLFLALNSAQAASLMDNSPQGFIHLKDKFKNGTENNYYISKSQVVSLILIDDHHEEWRGKHRLSIVTTATKAVKLSDNATGSASTEYHLYFKEKDTAESTLKKLFALLNEPTKNSSCNCSSSTKTKD
ncbi:hypothetical protein [Rubritalea sp.]|uniref:hypothetical protein n=1 Tax=Rubritalea sp. TaxID=2109375 RepID=UPI003EF2B82F